MAEDLKLISENPKPTCKLRHKEWKKLKRKQKRQAIAKNTNKSGASSETTDEEAEEARRKAIEEENARQNALWAERDRLGHELWQAKKEQEERDRKRKEEIEQKIREEWEERERREKEERERKEQEESEKREKQENLLKAATANENKTWHNPLAPAHYTGNTGSQQEIIRDINRCPFFAKTGACRFGDRCSRVHVRPESSTILLIPGMFESFELRKSATDDYDTDMGLEYEDSELYHSFREFYSDVLPEFRSVGKVINFKVCCNHEPHLRGNVYIQYKRETDAQQAFAKFNARWYAGRQLSCEFVNISKWKSAICGLFFAKRCPKGKACNFLHVFRNPGNEFWEADRDFEVSARGGRHDDRNASSHRHWRSHDDWRMRRSDGRHRGRDTPVSSRHRKRSRSRSKSRPRRGSAERDTSVSRSHHRNRSRSRSRERSQSKSQKISAERNSSVSRTNDHKSRSASRERSRSRSESRQMSPDKDHISPLRRHRRRSPSREEDSDSEAALSRKRKYRSARSQSVSSENSDASEQDEHSKASSSSNKKTKKHKKNKKSHKKKKKKRSSSAQKREVDNPAEEDGSVVSDERNGPSEKTGTNGHGNSHTNSEVWTSATELA